LRANLHPVGDHPLATTGLIAELLLHSFYTFVGS